MAVANANPRAYAADTLRVLFGGNASDVAVPRGFAVPAPIALLALCLAVRSFRRAA